MRSGRARLTLSTGQRLALNVDLQTSLTVLRLGAAELGHYLEEQAEQNPALAVGARPMPRPGEWLPRWRPVLGAGGQADPTPETERLSAAGPSLIAHVMSAVDQLPLGRAETRIAMALVEALEPTGWLGRKLEDIAEELGVAAGDVERMLMRLQRIEPPGLFARSLAECLRLQLVDSGEMDAILEGMLANLSLLARGENDRLARLLACDPAEITQRFARLRGLNPKPGLVFGSDIAPTRMPDLVLEETDGGGWKVRLNRSALPDLAVAGSGGRGSSPAGRRAAMALVRSVKARNATLLAVAEVVCRRQGEAVRAGMTLHRPLTMAEVAEELGVNESTVSRVVANTSMDSPRGCLALRAFFSPAAAVGPDGTGISSAALRAHLTAILLREPPEAPLRDQALAEALSKVTGVQLSRRTIAQYRELAGIPIAGIRKRRRLLRGARAAEKAPK